MTLPKVRFDRRTQDQIDDAMLSEEHLVHAIRSETPKPVPGSPGLVMCSLLVPVPRAGDPETAELRALEVTMSDRSDAVEVIRLDGLA